MNAENEYKSIQNKTRIIDSKSFFSLMKKERSNDSAHTIKEQIATEEQVKIAYEEFLKNYLNDPE
jgi:hypothetical protein